MDGLTKRLYILGAILLVSGAGIHLLQPPESDIKTEAWMMDKTPLRVSEYLFVPGSENPKYSYKMDKRTYELLNPDGILARVYKSDYKRFDVVLIMGRNQANFHDPRVCFQGQGWEFKKLEKSKVNLGNNETIPITLTDMKSKLVDRKLAAFFYKSGKKYFANTQEFKVGLMVDKLLSYSNSEGTFFRFIPVHEGASEEELKQFIAEYILAARKSSKGYF